MSSEHIFIITTFDIKDAEEFRRLTTTFAERIQGQKGVLQYDFYLSDDEKQGVNLGSYSDSETCIEHRRRAEPELWEAIYRVCTVTSVKIFGVPTPALVQDLADYDITWFGNVIAGIENPD